MYCHMCGTRLDEDGQFCHSCGIRMEVTTSVNRPNAPPDQGKPKAGTTDEKPTEQQKVIRSTNRGNFVRRGDARVFADAEPSVPEIEFSAIPDSHDELVKIPFPTDSIPRTFPVDIDSPTPFTTVYLRQLGYHDIEPEMLSWAWGTTLIWEKWREYFKDGIAYLMRQGWELAQDFELFDDRGYLIDPDRRFVLESATGSIQDTSDRVAVHQQDPGWVFTAAAFRMVRRRGTEQLDQRHRLPHKPEFRLLRAGTDIYADGALRQRMAEPRIRVRVEVLGWSPNTYRVRLEDGREGYVRREQAIDGSVLAARDQQRLAPNRSAAVYLNPSAVGPIPTQPALPVPTTRTGDVGVGGRILFLLGALGILGSPFLPWVSVNFIFSAKVSLYDMSKIANDYSAFREVMVIGGVALAGSLLRLGRAINVRWSRVWACIAGGAGIAEFAYRYTKFQDEIGSSFGLANLEIGFYLLGVASVLVVVSAIVDRD